MKIWVMLTLISLGNFLCLYAQKGIVAYVDPLIGTDVRIVKGSTKNTKEERGQVAPLVGVPYGMTNWVPQTQASELKGFPPYYYYQNAIQGFRASHWMNGSCTQDYGSVTVMPMTGKPIFNPEKRASKFEHQREVSTPYFYSVHLDTYNVQAQLTGLSHSGIMKFDFEKKDDRYLVVEPNSDEGSGFLEIDSEKREIRGYNPVHRIYQGFGEYAGFNGYFVIKLNCDIEGYGLWNGNRELTEENKTLGDKTPVGAWIRISSDHKGCVLVKIGTSFTSLENARLNLEKEIPGWNFNKVKAESARLWNQMLGKIKVKGKNENEKKKFYSALYNASLLPRTFSDVNGFYPVFETPGKVMKADGFTYYCDFSLWDTYRAVHPLLSIINSSINADMIRSFVLKGQKGGWLPIFPAWNNYTAAMIGDHGISLVGDAILKNTPGFDYEEAYKLMRKNAFEPNGDRKSYLDGKGRRAAESYLKYNYVPLEDEVKDAFHQREQVARTLEYAYDDFVLSQVARKLGKTEDYEKLNLRAFNYKNVIDKKTGYARGRYMDGSWITPFDPNKFVSYICEGTPYHYTWYVPHDVAGLVEQVGGKERFVERLDRFFEEGYYWHANEPCHHVAYLFNYVNEPWKTQKWIHQIIDNEYYTTPDGLCGNDDAGQMSAWLVFSMVGFYPVCPGMPYYVIGSPSFEEVSFSLEDGKVFRIKAERVSDENIYIQSATLNGKVYNKSYILHEDIKKGGVLSFVMGDTPNKQWASASDAVPYSLSTMR